MCGRFSQTKAKKDFEHYYGHRMNVPYTPNFNIAPTQMVPVVTSDGFQLMKWGLLPGWAKSEKIAYSMINARSETLLEKQTYKRPFLKGQRCLIPATGFYEWQKTAGGKKTPFNIFVKDQPIFSFAGLYIDDKDNPTFTIITTKPNHLMEKIHDRMPCILGKQEERDWLYKTDEPEDLLLLLDPYEDKKMDAYEVSSDVGNVRNNYPGLLERVG